MRTETRFLTARLLNQQLAAPRFTSAGELVRFFGAIQGQDYFGGLWAVGQRLEPASEADVEGAIAARSIVRTWPMRGTLHFVPAEDVRWMLALLTPRVIRLSAGRYRQLELDEKVFRRARTILVRALRGGRQLTRPEMYATLEKGGVRVADQRGFHILGHLAQQGVLCYGPRQGRQPTVVLLDEWVPPEKPIPREQALATLATRYFTSHGPATLQDFAWWSGLLMKEAASAIEAAGKALAEETHDGRRCWSGSSTPAGRSRERAWLLPPWDEYLVAYQDRRAMVDDDTIDRLKTIGSPVVLVDGRVRGYWKRVTTPKGMRVSLELATPLTPAERRAVKKAVLRYGRFLGKPAEIAERQT